MGDILHRDVIITSHIEDDDWKWLEEFRNILPEGLRFRLVGPISGSNGVQRWFFATSGSNAGWPLNEEHERYCQKLLEHFKHRALMVVHGDGVLPQVKTIEWKRPEE